MNGRSEPGTSVALPAVEPVSGILRDGLGWVRQKNFSSFAIFLLASSYIPGPLYDDFT
jgi:hypothetical protein